MKYISLSMVKSGIYRSKKGYLRVAVTLQQGRDKLFKFTIDAHLS